MLPFGRWAQSWLIAWKGAFFILYCNEVHKKMREESGYIGWKG